jgi:hypothetical protein
MKTKLIILIQMGGHGVEFVMACQIHMWRKQ